jgi:hypothetical protein
MDPDELGVDPLRCLARRQAEDRARVRAYEARDDPSRHEGRLRRRWEDHHFHTGWKPILDDMRALIIADVARVTTMIA